MVAMFLDVQFSTVAILAQGTPSWPMRLRRPFYIRAAVRNPAVIHTSRIDAVLVSNHRTRCTSLLVATHPPYTLHVTTITREVARKNLAWNVVLPRNGRALMLRPTREKLAAP